MSEYNRSRKSKEREKRNEKLRREIEGCNNIDKRSNNYSSLYHSPQSTILNPTF
jgi:hypothetical protein